MAARVNSYMQFDRYSRIPNGVMSDPNLGPTAKLVFGRLVQYAGHNGSTFPGYGTLSKEIGMDRSTVIEAIKQLIEFEYIEKESGGLGFSNTYYLLEHPNWSQSTPSNQGESTYRDNAPSGKSLPHQSDIPTTTSGKSPRDPSEIPTLKQEVKQDSKTTSKTERAERGLPKPSQRKLTSGSHDHPKFHTPEFLAAAINNDSPTPRPSKPSPRLKPKVKQEPVKSSLTPQEMLRAYLENKDDEAYLESLDSE